MANGGEKEGKHKKDQDGDQKEPQEAATARTVGRGEPPTPVSDAPSVGNIGLELCPG